MFNRGGDLSDAVLRAVQSSAPSSSSSAQPSGRSDSEVIARAKAKEKELLELYEKSKLRSDFSMAVPTVDAEVKRMLRELGEPICVFGEDPFDRRQRLKLLVMKGAKIEQKKIESKNPVESKTKPSIFYTHGSTQLLEARKRIAEISLESAKLRLKSSAGTRIIDDASSWWSSPSIFSYSQIGDSRPLSAIALSPWEPKLAVAGWSGNVQIFSSHSLQQLHSLRGHTDRCATVAWSPVHEENRGVDLASAGTDMKVHLWSLKEAGEIAGPAAVLEGHELRINRVAFHPRSENLLLSTSDDETWRLWDIERQEELLLQEGHVSAVFAVACHPDGSLAATSDTSGVIRVWDLRTGRSIIGFEGHMEQVVSLDFSPNGVTLASSSGDNSVRVWDLRKKHLLTMLTGHEKLVSTVKFDRTNGSLLLSSSYDCVARVWSTVNDFRTLKNLPVHESRIMAADMSADGRVVVTACYDRTFKLWTQERVVKPEMKLE